MPEGNAVLSPDGRFRYRLDRWWGDGPRVCFVMLNPSTADADLDDPTIRRCIGFAKTWGFPGLTVVNIWPLRATDPRALKRWKRESPDWEIHTEAERNGTHVGDAVREAPLTIAAWGVHTPETTSYMQARMVAGGATLHCLGVTRDGHPRHPLYVRGDTTPVFFDGTNVPTESLSGAERRGQ